MNRERFPRNDIISLLDTNPKFNMAESTPRCLSLAEILDKDLREKLSSVPLNYGTSQGSAAVRSLIASDAGVSSDEVLLTTGAAAATFLTVFCVCESGDEIVATTPNFPPTLDVINAVGAEYRPIELTFENSYQLNLSQLEPKLNANTKLVILVTPQNPSGVAIQRETINNAVRLVEQKAPNALLLVDESYRKAVYDDRRAVSSVAGVARRVLTTASLSKCHGTPGIRIGWVTCTNKRLMDQLVLAKMNTAVSCSIVDEFIAEQILRNEQPILSQHAADLSENLRTVRSWISEHKADLEWIEPDAGALCCVRLKPSRFDKHAVERLYELIGQSQSQIANGEWFGESRRVLRLGFGFLDKKRLESGLATLTTALQIILENK